jgi:RNA polymerase sigma-70 factor (ECF subfamily)
MANGPGAAGSCDDATSLSLLIRLRGQDRQAWQEFLTLYAPLVVRWCRRRGLADEDTADVAQEVFSRVARSLGQFRKESPEDTLRGWLYRITHREIAEFFRRRDPLAVPEGGTGVVQRLQQHADPRPPEPEGEEVRQEICYLYQKAVEVVRSEFSDSAWQMFWRTAVDGNPATEVAAEMGTTAAAVRQAKSRVLRRLKQAVGDLPD